MRRFITASLVLALLVCLILPVAAALQVKETDILTWSGSAWTRITKGQLYTMVGGANVAITQSATTGAGFTVSRNLAAGSTNSAVAYILQDNATDDQVALKIKDDGSGGPIACYDGANLVFTIADGGVGAFDYGLTVGGGYGSTGATFSAAGVGQFNGALTTDGAITAATAVVGGGYGATGLSVAATGALTSNSTAQFDGVVTSGVTGSNGGIVVKETSGGATTFQVTGATGNTTISGTLTALAPVVVNTDGTETLTAAQSGSVISCTRSDGNTTITLPDPGPATVGVVFRIVNCTDYNVDIVPTTADGNCIIADNVATSDKVSLSTAAHKIGAAAMVVGVSATRWHITALSPTCPLTVEAAD